MNIAEIAAIINGGGSGGGGYQKRTAYTTIYDETVFFDAGSFTMAPLDVEAFTGPVSESLRVTIDGQSYTATAVSEGSFGARYGAQWDEGYDFSEYPFSLYVVSEDDAVIEAEMIIDMESGEHHIKLETVAEEFIISEGFREAVMAVMFDVILFEDRDNSVAEYVLISGDYQKTVEKLQAGEFLTGIVNNYSAARFAAEYDHLIGAQYDDYSQRLKLSFRNLTGTTYIVYWYENGTITS